MEKTRTVYDDRIHNLTIEGVKQTAISDILDATNQLFNAYVQNDDKEFRKVIYMISNMIQSVEIRINKEQ